MRKAKQGLAGLALMALAVMSGGNSEPMTSRSSARTMYVSEVAKGAVNQFFLRMATPTSQIVVTDASVPSAIWSHEVKLAAHEHLILLEADPDQPEARAFGEIARRDDVIIAVWPDWVDADHGHDLYNVRMHANRVPSTLTSLPRRMGVHARSGMRLQRQSKPRGIAIDQEFLRQKVAQFSGAESFEVEGKTVTIRERGSKGGKDLARTFLRQELTALGYEVSEHVYSGGTNFIARRAAADSAQFAIVSAHLDSVNNAGADDDGTGMITVLGIAKALKDMPLKVGVEIVGFDQEELGLLGSKAYAAHLSQTNRLNDLIGVFNVEMTGFDGDKDGALHIIDCNENTSAELTARVEAVLTATEMDLKKVDACTNRSDHASFWRYDRPAIVVSQNFFGGDSNPCYHASCDTIAKLDFGYMTRITTVLAEAVASAVVAR